MAEDEELFLAVEKFLAGEVDQLDFLAENKKRRLFDATDLYRKYMDAKKCVPFLTAKYGISIAQAYRDVNHAIHLFGLSELPTAIYLFNVALANIAETHNGAKAVGDFRAQAANNRNLLMAIKDILPKITPLEKGRGNNIRIEVELVPDIFKGKLGDRESRKDKLKKAFEHYESADIMKHLMDEIAVDANIVEDGSDNSGDKKAKA